MQRIGLECLAVIFFCNSPKSGGPRDVYSHAGQYYDKAPNVDLNFHMPACKPFYDFRYDPEACNKEQNGFKKRRDIFHFPVPEVMLLVGRFA
jgi:hypothetical protein